MTNLANAVADRAVVDLAHDLVTPEVQQHYDELGWWVSPSFLDEVDVDTASLGAERIYAGEYDRPLPDGSTHVGWSRADGDVLRKNDQSSLLVHELRTVTTNPAIGAVAGILSGSDSIRLWHDQLLYKPSAIGPGGPSNVGWHTDRQYWLTATSTSMLTAWVPFHDMRHNHGPVMFVDGSHRWEGVVGDFWNVDLASALAALAADRDAHVSSPLVPKRGVSFHHCKTIHGSGPNTSGEPRRSIAVHLQPGDNRYAGDTAGDGTPITHALVALVRRTPEGVPDFSDPAVCPQLWPSSPEGARQ